MFLIYKSSVLILYQVCLVILFYLALKRIGGLFPDSGWRLEFLKWDIEPYIYSLSIPGSLAYNVPAFRLPQTQILHPPFIIIISFSRTVDVISVSVDDDMIRP